MRGLTHTARRLLRNPGYVITGLAVCVLSAIAGALLFGIAAYSVRHGTFKAAEELRFIYADRDGALGGLSLAGLERLSSSEHDVLARIAARAPDRGRIEMGGERLEGVFEGEMVSADYFDLLGVGPHLGRTFLDDDARGDATPGVVVSFAFWRNQLEGRADALGRVIVLAPDAFGVTSERGSAYTVIGVMPREFNGLFAPWTPATFWVLASNRAPDYQCFKDLRRAWIFAGVTRLDPARAGQLPNALEDGTYRLRESGTELPTSGRLVAYGSARTMLPIQGARLQPERVALILRIGALMLVVIGLSNFVGVFLARILQNRGQLALRAALGATPSHLFIFTATELLCIALVGCIAGALLSPLATRALLGTVPARYGEWTQIGMWPDRSVLAAVIGVCTALVVALALTPGASRPTGLARTSTSSAIVSRESGGTGMLYFVVIPQFALAVALLVPAMGLVARVLIEQRQSLGYQPRNLLVAPFEVPGLAFCKQRSLEIRDMAQQRADISRRVAEVLIPGLPGDAALASSAPFQQVQGWVVAKPHSSGSASAGGFHLLPVVRVSRGYFAVAGTPLLAGVDFDAEARTQDPDTAILSQAAASSLWPSADPLGQLIALQDPNAAMPPRWLRVIAIAGDTYAPLGPRIPQRTVYLPIGKAQHGDVLLYRPRVRVNDAAVVIRRQLQAIDPALFVPLVTESDAAIATIQYPERLAATLLAAAGAWGLGLAIIGLYGAVAYSAGGRKRELGMRSALGATRRQLFSVVLSDGLRVVTVGAVTGVVIAGALTKALRAYLVGFPLPGLASAISIVALAVGATALASYMAARSAVDVDPAVVLRDL